MVFDCLFVRSPKRKILDLTKRPNDQIDRKTNTATLNFCRFGHLVNWLVAVRPRVYPFRIPKKHTPSQLTNWPNDQNDRRINRYTTTSPGWSPKLDHTHEKQLTKWPKRQKDDTEAISVKLLSFWSFGRSHLPLLPFFCPGIIVALVLLPNLVSSISQTPVARCSITFLRLTIAQLIITEALLPQLWTISSGLSPPFAESWNEFLIFFWIIRDSEIRPHRQFLWTCVRFHML